MKKIIVLCASLFMGGAFASTYDMDWAVANCPDSFEISFQETITDAGIYSGSTLVNGEEVNFETTYSVIAPLNYDSTMDYVPFVMYSPNGSGAFGYEHVDGYTVCYYKFKDVNGDMKTFDLSSQ